MYGYPGGGHPTNSSFGVGYDSPSAAMALGVPGLELGLEGLPGGMGTPVGGLSMGHLGGVRADEDERRRRLGQVMDILKVGDPRALFTWLKEGAVMQLYSYTDGNIFRLAKDVSAAREWSDCV